MMLIGLIDEWDTSFLGNNTTINKLHQQKIQSHRCIL